MLSDTWSIIMQFESIYGNCSSPQWAAFFGRSKLCFVVIRQMGSVMAFRASTNPFLFAFGCLARLVLPIVFYQCSIACSDSSLLSFVLTSDHWWTLPHVVMLSSVFSLIHGSFALQFVHSQWYANSCIFPCVF